MVDGRYICEEKKVGNNKNEERILFSIETTPEMPNLAGHRAFNFGN